MSDDHTESSSSSPRPSGPSFSATFREHLDDSDPLTSDHPAPPVKHHSRSILPKERMRKSIDMVNALAFWRKSDPPTADLPPNNTPPPTPISSSARTVYILLTGKIPATPTSPPQKLEKKARHVRGKIIPPKGGVGDGGELQAAAEDILHEARLSGAEVRILNAQGYLEDVLDHSKGVKGRNKMVESRPVPNVPANLLRKAKKQLVDPVKARKIVMDLKRMQVPPTDLEPVVANPTEEISSPSFHTSTPPASTLHPSHSHTTKAFALPPLSTSTGTPSPNGNSNGDATQSSGPFTLISLASPGAIGAIGAQKTGAIDLLGDVSGALIRRSHTQDGLKAPTDRIGVFLWHWGFELTIPSTEMSSLSSIHSIQSTFFALLYAIIVAGGAPELLPYVRYISSYLDMEWGAIRSQDRGKGVVVAATWLLPVALVPRPWDFAIAPSTPPASPSFSSFSEIPLTKVEPPSASSAQEETTSESSASPDPNVQDKVELKVGEVGGESGDEVGDAGRTLEEANPGVV